MIDPAGTISDGQNVLPRAGRSIVCAVIICGVASCLLNDYNEEAFMKPNWLLIIRKIQQVIRRILAELERLSHSFYCLHENRLAGTSELPVAKLRFRRCRLLPLPNRLFSVLILSVQLRNPIFSNKYSYSFLYFLCSSLSAALLLLELYCLLLSGIR